MGKAKDIVLRPTSAKVANTFIRRYHYSGKFVRNSQLHIGVFYNGRLEGVMQFGPSMDKRKIVGLVEGTKWNEFIELNRMAFSDVLPRNSESRALAVAMRILRKRAPWLKWVVSFADATQCGDGTIYRASGFVLTGIKKNENIALRPDGTTVHKMTYESNAASSGYAAVTGGKYNWKLFVNRMGWKILSGYQLRYIYFLDKSYRERLTVPELPYDEIRRVGAGMYKGQRR